MPANTSVDRALAAIEKDSSKLLGVSIAGQAITKALYIPRASKSLSISRGTLPTWNYITNAISEAQEAPEISFPGADPSQTYLVVGLDLDAPFTWWKGLGPILHWIQPGYKVGATGILTSDAPFIVNYIGPAPPPGSAPHRYSFYAFIQPADFDAKKLSPTTDGKPVGNMVRMRFSLDEWIAKAGLADPIAANYFLSN